MLMFNWVNRISLLSVFIFLLAFHVILYYSLGTGNWFVVALLATFVDTIIVAGLQFLFRKENAGSR